MLRAFTAAVRVALLVAILVAGYMLIDMYRNLFTDPPPVAPFSEESPLTDPAGDLRDSLLDEGAWTVGGVGWAVKVNEVAADDVERRMQEVGDPLPAGRPEVEIERDLLRWAKRTGKRQPGNGCATYTATVGAFRMRVVTEMVNGTERVRLGQVVWGEGDPTTILDFTPAPATDGTAEPLLPVPAEASVQARRWSGGRVTAELVGPWADAQSFPVAWTAAGWVGRPLVVAPGDTDAGDGYEFRRGSEVIQVWRFGLPGAGGSLLVVRAPSRTR